MNDNKTWLIEHGDLPVQYIITICNHFCVTFLFG
jgi:hypothetical protein